MIDANKNPLGVLSLRLLQEAGQPAESPYLYALQLARWGLEAKPADVPSLANRFLPELREMVDQMFAWKPATAEPYLLPPDEAPADAASQLDGLSPREAAQVLVEHLYDNLSKRHPELRVVQFS